MRPALLVSGPGISSSAKGGPLSRAARDQALLAALREVRKMSAAGGGRAIQADSCTAAHQVSVTAVLRRQPGSYTEACSQAGWRDVLCLTPSLCLPPPPLPSPALLRKPHTPPVSVLLCAPTQHTPAALSQVFARGGNVLLPVDSSGRMLEVLLVLDQLWHTHK